MLPEEEKRVIAAIDLKSFYASVECLDRGLNPFTTPLAVVDARRGRKTIIMAVTPYLKARGVPSRLRLYNLPKIKGMIYARPRMARYIMKSVEVISVYLNYVAREDMHIYSVDEAFLDITAYLRAARTDKISYVRKIIDDVLAKTGLIVTAGIGENIFMAKAALDIEAKHRSDCLASWTLADISARLWPIKPLSMMWGIGRKTEAKLRKLGFESVGDIAVSDKEYLISLLGIRGQEIWNHANGLDSAVIKNKYAAGSRSLCIGQTLFGDYGYEDALLVIGEMRDNLTERMKSDHLIAAGVGLWCGYSVKGGFSQSMRLAVPTDRPEELDAAFRKLFADGYDRKSYIRQIVVSGFGLVSSVFRQPSLFENASEDIKERKKDKAIRDIKGIYGPKALFRASALLSASTCLRRAELIGGHQR